MSHHSSDSKGIEEHTPGDGLNGVHDLAQTEDIKKVIHVNDEQVTPAIEAGGLDPWSREALFLYWCAFVASVCGGATGYDSSIMIGINGMRPYIERFTNGTNLGAATGIIFSVYSVGSMVGAFFAGPCADRFGRRAGMFVGSVLICIGTAVMSTSLRADQFIAGRFIVGFGISFMVTAGPTYVAEIAPPQWRGKFTASFTCAAIAGSIVASAVVLGTSKIQNDWSWRLPLIFQAIPPLIVMTSVWFLPESPRWNIANGRDEEAIAFLAKYHGNGSRDNPIVQREWKQLKENIKLNASDKRWWDYSELIKMHSARWRLLMVILISVLGNFSGIGLGYFNLAIYEAVGYDSNMQFILNLMLTILATLSAVTGAALSDRMPRRKVLVVGTLLCAIWLGINGGLSKVWTDNYMNGIIDLGVGRGAVAAFFLFGITYSFTYVPLLSLYCVECLDNATRAKGMAIHGVISGILNFINNFATPVALRNIRYNYAFVFVAWDVLGSIIWYFLAVETVGRTLEELAEVFEAPNPVKYSIRKQAVAIRKDGAAVLVDET